ncbi:MAG: hypothetical protein EAZ27_03115 [Cytophagales bacterium]|nr:MAG: hypothetical protein EAZ27_03115 [Cytophagales bacterium]
MIDFTDIEFNKNWNNFLNTFSEQFGKKPDLNGILYLIGVQELGKGPQEFSKEEKQDLMHIATCKLFSTLDYYELEGHDAEGWPHWKQLKPLPKLNILEQEKLLKMQILDYFENIL